MKLFKETTRKKSFSVQVSENTELEEVLITLVDSRTGEFIANLLDITEAGVYFCDSVPELLKENNYEFNENLFNSNGKINLFNLNGKIKTI